ncbi:MAG: hypothetical protein LBC57_03030, partial [Treponema sp.]|nr:hypothetical protein [Treponema sp.]
GKPKTEVEVLQIPDLASYKNEKDCEAYLDISDFDEEEVKKILAAFAKKKRGGTAPEDRCPRQKFPPGKFEGWKNIKSGTGSLFLFLFISLDGKTNLQSRLGEAAYKTVKTRLRDYLRQSLAEADALLWMESETNNLYLIPPKAANARAAVEAALKFLLAGPLVTIEFLGLSIPVHFTAALHYGKTVYRAPGKTGTVVSDAVNYIFHLGAKHAESGRLTISADVPPEAVGEGLEDLFSDAGVFEGIPIRHSAKWTYASDV